MANLKVLVQMVSEKSPALDRNASLDGAGCHCRYIKVSDTVGIKCYRSRDARDGAFMWQRIASENGLGPDAYVKFEVNGFYCYSTEHVRVCKYGEYRPIQVCSLSRNLRDMDFSFTDCCSFNMGYKTDGTFVCIDFAEEFHDNESHNFVSDDDDDDDDDMWDDDDEEEEWEEEATDGDDPELI